MGADRTLGCNSQAVTFLSHLIPLATHRHLPARRVARPALPSKPGGAPSPPSKAGSTRTEPDEPRILPHRSRAAPTAQIGRHQLQNGRQHPFALCPEAKKVRRHSSHSTTHHSLLTTH